MKILYLKPSEEERFLSEEDMKEMTKLGKQLENPYSVLNMRKALENLRASNGRIAEDVEIATTHLYIR